MQSPAVKDPQIKIEYAISGNITISPVVSDNDNSLSLSDERGVETTSRIFLNESLTFPSRHTVFNHYFTLIADIYQKLEFNNPEIFVIACNLLQVCVIKNINDVVVSKTSDNEILLFRKKDGEFSNIVIDEDGDISYLFIGKKLGSEKTCYFPKKNGFDYFHLVSLL